MVITLTQKEYSELWTQTRQNNPQQLETELFYEMPKQLGKGYEQDIEVHPNLWLTIFNCEYHNDVLLKIPDWDRSLQFSVWLSGRVIEGGIIARIDYARQILLSRLENPPSLLELAQMVGVSYRTLRREFKELFGTTVFNYLIEKRMQRAQELLQQSHLSVAEVANLVGYSHLGQFAGVFRRKFGITPSQCFLGKKSVL